MTPTTDSEPERRRHVLWADRGLRCRLTTAWSRVVGAGWVGLTLALASVGASSQVIGRPVWWADDLRWGTIGVIVTVFVVFALCTGVAAWSFLGGPWIPHVSLAGGILLAVNAVVDRHSSPGGAVVTAALAGAGVLLGVGSLSGRRHDEASRVASSNKTSD